MALSLKIGKSFDLTIGKAATTESRSMYPSQTYKLTEGISWMQYGSTEIVFDLRSHANIAKALLECPPVSYIIHKKSLAFCNGKIIAANVNTKNPVTGLNKAYQDIIDKPNFLNSGYQFQMQIYSELQAYGFCVVLKIKPKGMEKLNTYSSIWALPGELISIKWVREYQPFKQKDILSAIEEIKFDGVVLNKEDIYIFTDTTTCTSNIITPTSRLTPLAPAINNLIINWRARGKLMNKPAGILSNAAKDNISTLPLDPKEKTDLQNDMKRYGMGFEQYEYIITNAALNWQAMSFPLNQMQLDIFERNDTITIAEGLNYPPFLLGLADKGIYNNVSEASKALYTESIIPDGNNYVQQLTLCLKANLDRVTYIIDFSDVPCLQLDQKYLAETQKIKADAAILQFDNNIITYNMMLEYLGYEKIAGKDLYKHEMAELQPPPPTIPQDKIPTDVTP